MVDSAPVPEASPDYDPFDDFNRAQGMGSVRDPYAIFRALRAKGPVQEMNLGEMLGVEGAPQSADAPRVFAVLSRDAVSEVLRDGERFSSRAYETTMGVVMGHTILEMDEPEHGPYRRLLQKAFTKRGLDRWQREIVVPTARALVERFADRGRAELVRELTFPFPVTVIASMLGVPETDREQFHRWAIELISVGFDWQRALRASRELEGYFAARVAERRPAPGEDLISLLVGSEVDGERLGDDAIIAFSRLLLPAGAETTYRSASNLILGLLTHPDQLERVRADRSLIPVAIEEGLRWEPPITGIIRMAARDTELCGVAVPAGAWLHVNLAAANHDEARHPEPERFDIARPPRQHMAFGYGRHRCLGMHLARMETRVLLEALFDRLPDLRLDPEAEDVHVTGVIFRSPLSIPVVFEPVGDAA